ncbi:MAG: T9SS type A sorting domain-containing protein [Flavobacteriales bacterium]|nr:T9SS type A sorting domain-containing protein [Flavobacteriales bacterium]
MKKLLLTCLIYIAITNIGTAQNYSIIDASKSYSYYGQLDLANYDGSYTSSYLSGIVGVGIDSSVTIGADEYHYFSSMKRGSTDEYSEYCIADGVLGSKAIVKADGTTVLFNGANDSIFFSPFLGVDASWKMYEWDNGDYILASVISGIEYSVLGVTDSVKVIQLKTFDNEDNPLAHYFNNESFYLSKNYGLVVSYDIYHFPKPSSSNSLLLSGITNPNMGEYPITAADIYNFDVGDLFQHEVSYSPMSCDGYVKYIERTILDKTVSANLDTMVYSVELKSFEVKSLYCSNDTVYILDTITETYIVSNKVGLNAASNNVNRYGSYAETDYTRGIAYKTHFDYYYNGGNNECVSKPIGSLSIYDVPVYAEGLGLYNDIASDFDWSSSNVLVYYEKGSTIWGTPFEEDLLTSVEAIESNSIQISVYPNSTSGSLSVQANSKIENVEIWNVQGELIITTSKSQINLDGNPAGIYLVRVITEGGTFTRKVSLFK